MIALTRSISSLLVPSRTCSEEFVRAKAFQGSVDELKNVILTKIRREDRSVAEGEVAAMAKTRSIELFEHELQSLWAAEIDSRWVEGGKGRQSVSCKDGS